MGLKRKPYLLLLVVLLVSCGGLNGPYMEAFEEAGNWGVGADVDAEGTVVDDRYEFLVKSNLGLFWSTAGRNFDDGVYTVEATQLEGPLDNGYGMLFRVDDETDSFYMFEVSGDGYVWIGRCENGCDEEQVLIEDGWFASEAVNQGLDTPNELRVRAEGANMIFSVNDQEVGRVTDDAFSEGDIGIMVETLGQGEVLVAFDNFTVTPLER
jgi:hypothetical protein